ncbi:MAG: ATP-binding protein [Pseudomonadota bacterium]
MAREDAVGDMRSLTYALSSQFNMAFTGVEDTLVELGSVEQVMSASSETCSSWLRKSWPKQDYVNGIFKVDSAGTITCSYDENLAITELDIGFDLARPSVFNEVLFSYARESRTTGRPVIGITRTFWNDGHPFRLLITLDVDWMEDTIKAAGVPESSRFFLLDADGVIVLALPNGIAYPGDRVPTFRGIVAPRQDPIVHVLSAGFDGKERISSTVKLHEFNDGQTLTMSLTSSPDVLYAQAREILFIGSITLLFALGGVMFSQWVILRRYLSHPMKRILSYTRELAAGAEPKPLEIDGPAPQELNAIADATQKMAYENQSRASALSEALQNLERAEDVARLGHWRLDLKQGSLFWSDGVYRLHGLEPSGFEPTLQNAVDRYHPDDRGAMEALVEEAIDTGKPFDTVKRIVKSDGKYLYVRARGFVMRDRSGETLSVFGIIIDVDAPKRAARELERAQTAAQTLAETRAQLLATVSHEIKAPVGAILEICRTVKNCKDQSDTDGHLALIDSTGQMLLAVIGDLLDSSVIESGYFKLRRRQSDVRALLQQCHQTFQVAYGSDAISLSLEIAPDIPKTVFIDPQRLRQVLFNLLSNACKQIGRGDVKLSAHLDGASLALRVSDNGPGMSAAVQENLFKPYASLASRAISPGSTGLGLAIVQTLVTEMQGQISVQSALGNGCVVTVILPVENAQELQIDEDNAPSPHSLQKATGPVLVVEDNPVNQKLITAHLEKRGIPFVLHGDGQSAMEWLLSLDAAAIGTLPCLALLDINMPRLDGIGLSEFIRRQWAGPRDLPIYLVTADVIVDHDYAIKDLAIDGFVAKPIDFTALFEIVESAMALAKKAA